MLCCGGGAGKTVVLEELRERSPFGAYLTGKELRQLAAACRIDRFSAGAEVRDSPFYILLTGKLRIDSLTTGETLCTRGQGAFFTRNAGLIQDSHSGIKVTPPIPVPTHPAPPTRAALQTRSCCARWEPQPRALLMLPVADEDGPAALRRE